MFKDILVHKFAYPYRYCTKYYDLLCKTINGRDRTSYHTYALDTFLQNCPRDLPRLLADNAI